MSPTAAPELSFVVVTDVAETIAELVEHVRALGGERRVELVVAAPAGNVDEGDELFAGLDGIRVVEVDRGLHPPAARAEAVRAARAPVVMFAETHAVPLPGYADAVLTALAADDWAAVGPAMENANPESAVSWANFLIDYGPWHARERRGDVPDVPGHNSSYRSEVLTAFGDELGERLRADSLMHRELAGRGARLLFEPAARVAHVNVSHPGWAVLERFHSGRNFAGRRARGWPPWRRALYVAGSPLIPAVRFVRILPVARRSPELRGRLAGVLPTLALLLVVSAAGELAGYLRGPGLPLLLFDIDIHRRRYLRRSEPARRGDRPA